jgi:polysaccharide export outer membrane protein
LAALVLYESFLDSNKPWEGCRLLKIKNITLSLGVGILAARILVLSPAAAAQSSPPPATPNPDAAAESHDKKAEKSSAKPSTNATVPKGQHAPEGYRIGVDDSLFISVWKEPDLSSQVTVRPDGVITLPLINDIPVVGLSPKELQDLLTEKLKPFVNEPQVTVVVRDIRSRKVFLVGQAGKPGSYQLTGNMTLLELLAQAGGLGQFAKSESIYIMRNQDGKQVRIGFKYKKVLQGKEPDLVLLPGDMIVVP